MGDFFLGRACDHLIVDELLSINGLSPNYYATLNYLANGATSTMVLREFGATEGMTNFIYTLNGFTNWNLLSDRKTVQFNTLGLGTGAAAFLDGSTLINPAPLFLASYTATADTCPKHLAGVNIMNDLAFDSGGRLRQVTGLDKVRQQVVKAILTALGANQFHPDYGSTAQELIGQKFDIFAQLKLQQTIQGAVQGLIAEQQSIVNLPLDETITRISNLQVSQASSDPRTLNVLIKIQTGTYEEAAVSLPILTE